MDALDFPIVGAHIRGTRVQAKSLAKKTRQDFCTAETVAIFFCHFWCMARPVP